MRIRRRKWAKQELEESKFYLDDPSINKGKWNTYFKNTNPIYLEIGCGKGAFIAELASNNLETNYIAADMIEAMLGLSKRNIEQAYKEKNIEDISNIALIRMNAERILDVFDENDVIDRIYINFCNPWPRGKHKKRRLTHIRQLEHYKVFLKPGGEIYFKTDNDELFEESLEYFEEAGFDIISKTYDFQKDLIFEDILTEHEIMYTNQGIKIKALIAKLKI